MTIKTLIANNNNIIQLDSSINIKRFLKRCHLMVSNDKFYCNTSNDIIKVDLN